MNMQQKKILSNNGRIYGTLKKRIKSQKAGSILCI